MRRPFSGHCECSLTALILTLCSVAAARGAGGARQQHAAAALRPHHRAHAVGHQ